MRVVLGKDSNTDIGFKLDIEFFRGKVFIREESMGKAIDSYNTMRNLNVKSRVSNIASKKKGKHRYYNPTNAVHFLDQIHISTRPKTALLMMKIATEL